MRELMFGPKRFSDLRAGLPGISANVLTQRLEGLIAAGVVTRRKLPPPAAVQVYELTEWGYESEPIFHALGRWAARSPWHDTSLPFSAASLLLSFRTLLDAERARGLNARIGLRLGTEQFIGHLADGQISFVRADPAGADVIFTAEPRALAAAVYGGVSFEALEAAGVLRIGGHRALAERFRTLFPLPAKAGTPAAGRDAGSGIAVRTARGFVSVASAPPGPVPAR